MRKRFYEEHKKNDAVLRAVSTTNDDGDRVNKKPPKMTTVLALQSGQTVDRSVALYKNKSMTAKRLAEIFEEQPFKGVSVFATFFGSKWQMIERTGIDPAHEISNLVKDMLALMLNKNAMEFKPKRLEEEQKMGRYKNWSSNKKASWRISAQFIMILSTLLASNQLKISAAWPRLLNYFTDEYEKIKLAEAMAFCGDRGCYFIGLTDIDPAVKQLFMELLRVVGGFMKKYTIRSQLLRYLYYNVYIYIYIYFLFNSFIPIFPCFNHVVATCNCTIIRLDLLISYMYTYRLHERLVVVLAELEILLPIYWNTSTRHYLLHMYQMILSLGHFWAISMLGVERLHVLIKRLGIYKLFNLCITIFICLISRLYLLINCYIFYMITLLYSQGQKESTQIFAEFVLSVCSSSNYLGKRSRTQLVQGSGPP